MQTKHIPNKYDGTLFFFDLQFIQINNVFFKCVFFFGIFICSKNLKKGYYFITIYLKPVIKETFFISFKVHDEWNLKSIFSPCTANHLNSINDFKSQKHFLKNTKYKLPRKYKDLNIIY